MSTLVAGTTACSLLLDMRSKQCSTDGDCNAFEQGLRCVDSSCVASLVPDAATREAESGTDAGNCSTNAECVDRLFGEPAICAKPAHQCVALKLADACSYVLPKDDLKNDNLVLFGAFVPLHGGAPLTQPVALAYQLALEEIRKAGGHGGPPSSYWLAYGLFAAGPGALSTSSAGVTFVGALGPPDIDPATGTWQSVGAVYCYPPAVGSIAPSYDVLRYNRSTGNLDGDFSCFVGF